MLLDRLEGERSLPEESERPMIFVSHSLGGIVVKKVSQ
jgi:predicted alpha/beta hydrolase family esterase